MGISEESLVTARKILLGNEAMAYGLLEAGCTLAASYPGTPASEVLGTLARMRAEAPYPLHVEWSINEKVAFEVALANSYCGRRSAAIMKQVGLNVAADPLMSAAYTGVKGGFVLVAADDPGPHSSQTEQDSRFMAMAAKIPVLDPSLPEEARQLIGIAFALSEKYEIPVMLRPTTRVCHARQDMERGIFGFEDTKEALFEKNPARWAATPKFRLLLHRQLNEKLSRIAAEPALAPRRVTPPDGPAAELNPPMALPPGSCIVASGAVLGYLQEVMADLGVLQDVPLYAVTMPFPLSQAFRQNILSIYSRVLVLEETYPVIEMQMQDRLHVEGRLNGFVPSAGELLPEVVEEIVRRFLELPTGTPVGAPSVPGRRPTLCAGCPHRAAFHAIKKVFPKAIYPGDIGCYTLGLNLGAVDTVLCMGASISQAAGFYHATRATLDEPPPICATIGDSTFFHAGIPALINAVVQGTRFTLVILDNGTTAMTGHQPTPALGRRLDGMPVPAVRIPDLVRACGVRFLVEEDPYRFESFAGALEKARAHTESEDGGIAVVIAKHPCLMDRNGQVGELSTRVSVTVSDKCKGCGICISQFECPALQSTGEKSPIRIDETLCTGCGVCVHACPQGALEVF